MPFDLQSIVAGVLAANAKWAAGATAITDLSDSQRAARLGYTPGAGDISLAERIEAALANLPSNTGPPPSGSPVQMDWRNVDGASYISAIKDQGNCGSCVAFGTCAAIGAGMRIAKAQPVGGSDTAVSDVSEAQLFYCGAEQQDGKTCETGWSPTSALPYCQSTGLVSESVFPYTACDQPCNLPANWQESLTKISGSTSLNSLSVMKTAIAQSGPLITVFMVFDDFYSYTSGVYTRTSDTAEGGHCICVIGYDDSQEAWLCKNSWGTGWGEEGFFWIGYGQCGIDAQMYRIDGFTSIVS